MDIIDEITESTFKELNEQLAKFKANNASLRTEVARLEFIIENVNKNTVNLHADNARLREALRYCAAGWKEIDGRPVHWDTHMQGEPGDRAREALAATEPPEVE